MVLVIRLPDKRIVVTGGAGFLGTHLRPSGCNRWAAAISSFPPPDYDLTRIDSIERLFANIDPKW
jgi:nucleoside-diphosphate-sugar epimerase